MLAALKTRSSGRVQADGKREGRPRYIQWGGIAWPGPRAQLGRGASIATCHDKTALSPVASRRNA